MRSPTVFHRSGTEPSRQKPALVPLRPTDENTCRMDAYLFCVREIFSARRNVPPKFPRMCSSTCATASVPKKWLKLYTICDSAGRHPKTYYKFDQRKKRIFVQHGAEMANLTREAGNVEAVFHSPGLPFRVCVRSMQLRTTASQARRIGAFRQKWSCALHVAHSCNA